MCSSHLTYTSTIKQATFHEHIHTYNVYIDRFIHSHNTKLTTNTTYTCLITQCQLRQVEILNKYLLLNNSNFCARKDQQWVATGQHKPEIIFILSSSSRYSFIHSSFLWCNTRTYEHKVWFQNSRGATYIHFKYLINSEHMFKIHISTVDFYAGFWNETRMGLKYNVLQYSCAGRMALKFAIFSQ